MIKKIISGRQTGADRAALDVAIKLGIPHGGWIPKGRETEDGKLRHGIFSYYLLEGLKGKADHDSDGITVSELFSFLSRKVPEASGQDQHPVRKGETEEELVIGRVK